LLITLSVNSNVLSVTLL
jgi:hypothetical protein